MIDYQKMVNTRAKIGAIVLLSLAALIMAQAALSQTGGTATTTPVNISAGWNIVGVGTLYGLQSTTCDKSQIYKTILSYNPAKGDYDVCQLTADLSSGQCLEFVRAAWVLNLGKKCTMFSLPGVANDYNIKLSSGWNMLAVLPQWEDKRVSQIIPQACGFRGGWAYNSTDWTPIDQNTALGTVLDNDPTRYPGKGFWAYADNDCSFLAG